MKHVLSGMALAVLIAVATPGVAQAHQWRHHHQSLLGIVVLSLLLSRRLAPPPSLALVAASLVSVLRLARSPITGARSWPASGHDELKRSGVGRVQ
jgi:hypothetical protein